MKAWQYVLIAVMGTIVSVGLVVMLWFIVPSRADNVCSEIDLEVTDWDEHQFVTVGSIERHLKSAGLYPVGKRVSEISLAEIERAVGELSLVKEAVCYFDSDGRLSIKATQRVPLYRVKDVNNDYYVDTDRKKMPTSIRYTTHVPIVTGNVNAEFAIEELFDFMSYISSADRWATAFTQVYVYPDNEVELVPRVGNFIIAMGSLDRYEEKLYKLDVFLDKMPKYKPWDEYSVINLKYKNQVVCTRR